MTKQQQRQLYIVLGCVCLAGLGLWGVLFLAMGGGAGGPGGMGDKAVGGSVEVSADLTAEQRAAWDRARKSHGQPGACYVFCLVGVNEPQWGCLSLRARSGYEIDRGTDIGSPFPVADGDGLADVEIKKPSVVAAVVVDLFSKPNPQIVSWHTSKGKSSSAPTSAIANSFRKHLQAVQAHIGD